MIIFDIETVEDIRNKESNWDAFRMRRKLEPSIGGGLFAEFGKVHTICAWDLDGRLFKNHIGDHFESDCKLLQAFHQWLRECESEPELCGWNIKGFDIPFIAKRCLYNSIKVPRCLQVGDKKPWEIKHFDLMEYIKFGGRDYVSMHNFAIACGFATSKNDIDGSMVNDCSLRGEHGRIADYCMADVDLSRTIYNHIMEYGGV